MQPAQKRKIVEVERGLFLIRYAAADDEASPPSVRLSADFSSRADIRFVLHPDELEPVLRYPGSCLIMRADAHGRLVLDITPARGNGSVAAKVRIEPLIQSDPALQRQQDDQGVQSHHLEDLRIVGHVASRGDVVVETDAWLAGPSAPSRIEGLRIDWPGKPNGLDIRYAVKTARPQAGSGQMVGLGTFVGSRGRSLPIVSLILEMAGPAAARYQFAAEMIFLGSPMQRMAGGRIAGSGPTGREPLVGLRLTVEDRERPTDHLSVATLIQPPRPMERVRVFRSERPDSRPIA